MPEDHAQEIDVIELTKKLIVEIVKDRFLFYERDVQKLALSRYPGLFPSNQEYSLEIRDAIVTLIEEKAIDLDCFHDRLMPTPTLLAEAAARS